LLPSLKNGFEQSVLWKIDKIPLFIYATDPTANYEITIPFVFQSQKIDFVDKDIKGREFYYTPINIGGKTAFKILFHEPTPILNNKEPYYILYSENFSLVHLGGAPFAIPSDPLSYNYSLGVKEEFIGISLQKLNIITTTPDLKDVFKFPTNNDFSILVYDSNELQIFNYSTSIIPVDAKVYGIQYTSFILYQNSSRVPVFVQLKIC
jgi:hypothetical protein